MTFAEFLEMIGRVAEVKYKESMLTLVEKIDLVMDDLLKIINCTRNEVSELIE